MVPRNNDDDVDATHAKANHPATQSWNKDTDDNAIG